MHESNGQQMPWIRISMREGTLKIHFPDRISSVEIKSGQAKHLAGILFIYAGLLESGSQDAGSWVELTANKDGITWTQKESR